LQEIARGTEEEITAQMQLILDRDYRKSKLAGGAAETLFKLEKFTLVDRIKRLLECVPPYRRNCALESFIQTRIKKLDTFTTGHDPTEQAAFSSLVRSFARGLASGSVLTADIRVAAKVAAGALHGDAVVNCLVRSFIDMKDKLDRGTCTRIGSSRHMDEETAAEVAFTLGRSQQSKELIKMFGVNKKSIPTVHLQVGYLPDFFVASRDHKVLQSNGRLVLRLLQCRNSRNFLIIMDETCYSIAQVIFFIVWDCLV